MLRNGQAIEGRLYDVGGTRPLRITVDTASGQRNFNSSEVAQIFLATPPGAAAVGTAGAQAAGATTGVRVDANQAWVDSGVNVTRGDRVAFSASGDIMVAPGSERWRGWDAGAVERPVPGSKRPGRRADRQGREQRSISDRIEHPADSNARRRTADAWHQRRWLWRQHRVVLGHHHSDEPDQTRDLPPLSSSRPGALS